MTCPAICFPLIPWIRSTATSASWAWTRRCSISRRWGFSDLRLNIVRGVLAELLVAKAVGSTEVPKEEWGNFDVRTPTGVRVEVKASAYWQSWAQRGPSKTIFSGLTGRSWSEDGSYSETREVRADVFVFALQACRDRERYDPLDAGQWEFRVLPARVIREAGTRSIGVAFLDRHGACPAPWSELAAAIDAAFELEDPADMNRPKLERVAELIAERNSVDAEIGAITGRPALAGHLGEWIAAQIFDIALESSAVAKGIDGRLTSAPLEGRTINVKWYAKREGNLDLVEDSDARAVRRRSRAWPSVGAAASAGHGVCGHAAKGDRAPERERRRRLRRLSSG